MTNNAQPTVVVGPRVRGRRQRLHLLARCEDRLRLLVVPERIDRPQLADGRRGQRAGRGAVGGVLRRRPRQRVRARRADRPAAVEDARRRSRRRPHHRQREVSRRPRLRAGLRAPRNSTAGNKDYPCCTARGGVVALDASTGKQIWKTYNVDEPKPWKKNPNGVQLYGPAAGGVWNSPTIDPVRGALYVGTGDAVTPPESPLTDAVMALDLKTGKVLWSRRATENDLFMGGCAGPNKSEACPSPMGPDYDIGNSPILVTLPNGKRALFAGTKGADVLALDPDANGARAVPRQSLGPAGRLHGTRRRGGIVWGGAGGSASGLLRHGRRGPRRACSRPTARRRGCSRLRAPAARQCRHSARRRRRFPASSSRVPATAGSSPCRRPTASSCGSSTPRRTFETVNKVPGARRRDRHVGRGDRRRHGLRRIRLRDQQRRVGRQRAAGVWRGVRARRTLGSGLSAEATGATRSNGATEGIKLIRVPPFLRCSV